MRMRGHGDRARSGGWEWPPTVFNLQERTDRARLHREEHGDEDGLYRVDATGKVDVQQGSIYFDPGRPGLGRLDHGLSHIPKPIMGHVGRHAGDVCRLNIERERSRGSADWSRGGLAGCD